MWVTKHASARGKEPTLLFRVKEWSFTLFGGASPRSMRKSLGRVIRTSHSIESLGCVITRLRPGQSANYHWPHTSRAVHCSIQCVAKQLAQFTYTSVRAARSQATPMPVMPTACRLRVRSFSPQTLLGRAFRLLHGRPLSPC